MRVTTLRPQDYQRAAWKNGLGFTDQIAIHPPGADLRRGDFLWRISSARIERSAPFSIFPNHDRVLVILEGGPVKLSHVYEEGEPADVVELPAHEPYEFPGDIATQCELLGGPVQDLSVFIGKGRVSAQAEVLEISESAEIEPQGETLFVYVVRGAIAAGSHEAGRGATLRFELQGQPEPIELRAIEPGTRAVVIHIAQG